MSKQQPLARRSFAVIVPIVGLVVAAIILLGIVPLSGAIAPGYDTILVAASVLFLISAGLIWVKPRFGYPLGALFSVLFLAAFSSDTPHYLTGFADFYSFVSIIVIVPILILVLITSLLGARRVFAQGSPFTQGPPQGKMFPVGSVITLLVVGFVLGGVFVGALANGSVLAIGNSANLPPANVVIPSGAYSLKAIQWYVPEVLTVPVGTTVTWLNNDTVTHTITTTSVPSGASSFTSGFLAYGNKFSYTFTVPGTYTYDCTVHPFMTGTIVVTA